jgi:hypothetical protein
MKKILLFTLIVTAFGCKNQTAETQKQTVETVVKDSASTPSVSGTNCSTKGEIVESFEQNGAKFERFRLVSGDSSEYANKHEWLKISLPNGSCTIMDSIQDANHYGCAFEDWNGDGLKDKVEYYKWDCEVSLFSKTKNDFSDKINGRFSGEQWDFDKTKGLKWQFLEDKMGGTFQLYALKGLEVKIYSEVNFQTTENDGYAIETRNNIVKTADSYTSDNQKVNADKFLLKPKERGEEQYEAMMERWKASVKRYWDKNLATILKEK